MLLQLRNGAACTNHARARMLICTRAAFSLIELLVVIGILGILIGVLVASFGGATESARAAQCLTNMKSLAQAVNSRGVSLGYYPLASSRESVYLSESDGKSLYEPHEGWISWYDEGVYENSEGIRVSKASKIGGCEIVPFYGTGDRDRDFYVLTNGVIWKTIGGNRSLYTCPEHVHYRNEKRLPAPVWSYVMNSKFGYDYSAGSRPTAGSSGYSGIYYGQLARADRTLLFAELPTVDPVTRQAIEDGSDYTADATLQYKGTVNGKNYQQRWSGQAESIGFVHKTGKTRYCAHLVFADGHTEKLVYADGGLQLDVLTTLLCEGIEVAFDGKGYFLPGGMSNLATGE